MLGGLKVLFIYLNYLELKDVFKVKSSHFNTNEKRCFQFYREKVEK